MRESYAAGTKPQEGERMINLASRIQKMLQFNSRSRDEEFHDPLQVWGAHSYGSINLFCWSTFDSNPPHLVVGKYCSIASDVVAVVNGDHRLDWGTTFPMGEVFGIDNIRNGHPRTTGPVTIGHDVWIATRATILGGVSIGSGAVVAAGALVTRSVRPYAIVGGNPAREIRRRFDDDTVDRLLRLEWWDLAEEDVRKLAPLLSRPLDIVALEIGVSALKGGQT
jgi:acetyltransferase-like isoleucine patch superfamily enzyme